MNLLFLTNFLFAGNAAAKEGSNPSAEQKKLLSLGFKKIVYEQINTLAPLTEEEKRRGYLLFVRDWMEMIYPNTIPQRKEIDNKEISLFASLGEYEPAAFGIHPLKDLKNIEVIASDLTGGTNTISKENIKIRVTRYMNERMSGKTRTAGDYTYYLAGGSWSKTYMLIPKVLDDYSKFSIKKGQTKQIWLTFKIPENSKPGNYQGSVLFKPENEGFY